MYVWRPRLYRAKYQVMGTSQTIDTKTSRIEPFEKSSELLGGRKKPHKKINKNPTFSSPTAYGVNQFASRYLCIIIYHSPTVIDPLRSHTTLTPLPSPFWSPSSPAPHRSPGCGLEAPGDNTRVRRLSGKPLFHSNEDIEKSSVGRHSQPRRAVSLRFMSLSSNCAGP